MAEEVYDHLDVSPGLYDTGVGAMGRPGMAVAEAVRWSGDPGEHGRAELTREAPQHVSSVAARSRRSGTSVDDGMGVLAERDTMVASAPDAERVEEPGSRLLPPLLPLSECGAAVPRRRIHCDGGGVFHCRR